MWWYIFLQDDVRCNEIRNYSHCEINGTVFCDVCNITFQSLLCVERNWSDLDVLLLQVWCCIKCASTA